jgi:PPOX class probable F420-dependent enzyme
MRLDAETCWSRLAGSDHGVLGTVHPERGVDLVPVVLAVTADRRLAIPVDTVKPKASTRLQRVANLERDPRCVVLVDRYDPDWSKLWWVRVTGTAIVVEGMAPELHRFEQYARPGAVESTILIAPTEITGWSA